MWGFCGFVPFTLNFKPKNKAVLINKNKKTIELAQLIALAKKPYSCLSSHSHAYTLYFHAIYSFQYHLTLKRKQNYPIRGCAFRSLQDHMTKTVKCVWVWSLQSCFSLLSTLLCRQESYEQRWVSLMRIAWPVWPGIQMANASSQAAREASSTSVWVSLIEHTLCCQYTQALNITFSAFTSHGLFWKKTFNRDPLMVLVQLTPLILSWHALLFLSLAWFKCWNGTCLLTRGTHLDCWICQNYKNYVKLCSNASPDTWYWYLTVSNSEYKGVAELIIKNHWLMSSITVGV